MKVKDLIHILDAEVLCGEDFLGQEITDFGACDLLSDILAYSKDDYVLLTGLTSSQVVRTAELTGQLLLFLYEVSYPLKKQSV